MTTKLPSSSRIALAIALELGKAGGPNIYKNYPVSFNKAMLRIGVGVRRQLLGEMISKSKR